jgi:hypothetical protein
MLAAIASREISVFEEAVEQGRQYMKTRLIHEMNEYHIGKKYINLPDKVKTLSQIDAIENFFKQQLNLEDILFNGLVQEKEFQKLMFCPTA